MASERTAVHVGPSSRTLTAAADAAARWGAVLVVAMLVAATLNHVFGEKIGINQGLGWDGSHYGAWAVDFHGEVLSKGLNSYYVQRMLPSATVHYSLRLLGIEPTVPNVINGFGVLNIACLTLSAWVWVLTARYLRVDLAGLILGFVGLFVNFFVLKFSPFYPVLTDVPTYLVGFLTIYFYLTGRRGALLATTILSSFMWPTAIYLGAVLLLFPREPATDTDAPARHPALPIAVALIPVAALFAITGYLGWTGWEIPFGVRQPIRWLLAPSIALMLGYVFVVCWSLFNNQKLCDLHYWKGRLSSPGFYVMVAALVAVKVILSVISPEPSSLEHEKLHVAVITMTGVARPAAFFIPHVLFFGPIALLILIAWRPMVRLIHRHGTGLALAIALGVLIGLKSESRNLVNILPLVMPFAVLACRNLAREPGFLWGFFFVSLVFSKFWLRINVSGDPDAWPNRLFWTDGPWIPTGAYFLQALLVVLWGTLLWLSYRSARRAGDIGGRTV
jgi:hypothetical protein